MRSQFLAFCFSSVLLIGFCSLTAQASNLQVAQSKEQPPITESEVKSLLNQIELAAKAHDASLIMGLITPDAKFSLSAPEFLGGKQTLTAAEYGKNLELGWKMLKGRDYSYQIKNLKFKIYPEKNQVLITSEVHESFQLDSKKIMMLTQEKTLVVRHQGKLKIKAIIAEMKQK